MSLTPCEKAAGRQFRDWCAARLAGMEEAVLCSPYHVWYRHECKAGERAVESATWAMPLRQHYWLSPETAVFPDGTAEMLEAGWQGTPPPGVTHVPAGKFAFIFRRGTCPRCMLLVRSGSGRFVLASENLPEKGAVVAYPEPNRAVPADQGSPADAS